jgi:hypothetical protein
VPVRIDPQIVALHDSRLLEIEIPVPAEHRLDASQQDHWTERFGDIVLGT